MGELATTFKPIVEKIGNFFHIADLSFIISGVATSTIILVFMYYQNVLPDIHLRGRYIVILTIFFCYIMGIISFSTGRIIRKSYKDFLCVKKYRKAKNLRKNIVQNELLKKYRITLTNNESFDVLYGKTWARLREDNSKVNSYKHINRYWVMAAMCDGLGFSCVLGFILTLWPYKLFINNCFLTGAIASFICFTIVIFYEADKYDKFQKEDLFAVYSEF